MICAAVFAIPPLLRSSTAVIPICSSFLQLKHAALCYCTVNGKMKSKKKSDHLERTANDFRQEIISKAKVCGITSESETVKRLRLAVADKEFTFKAGQWVDFFIPGVAVVGGFSICSSPGLLEQEGELELAVKHTTHPPAHWVHTQCALNSEVALRVGGNFFFDPRPADSPADLVLIAGGVGINPLFSILLHVADLHQKQENRGTGYHMGTTNLFYSAKNSDELLFRKHILGLTDAFPGKITCSFHVTQQRSEICENLQPYVKEGRISGKDLEKYVYKKTLWYICGPPPMIESISKLLENLGVAQKNIFFEKWW
ncbi:oxidoreductase NAD-binding domain-containing protein 1 [Eublepharis macularius]|uniref:Oxidoreductase NAD-binding domain-containing protein 1 n=1 Tax=Eublepharis macularius TaxID=481883 RepID=A0AA97K2X3_EUBMA|nr:oxidoreductase NAD-binding domain-containing protein 1 [Eublepharis macularius]XP_054848157.1 oxidoreductase NAD-binding domain-containing protein 1 [Eublepharis macularius]XP_054848158.1 oxidoreductase NAD-binding domain-containing protein 1 [Eublepharis macularius]XP_054848159.1 oxidoreductase NAD-binding domain-containing protein 1 [Eublepharis macularius]